MIHEFFPVPIQVTDLKLNNAFKQLYDTEFFSDINFSVKSGTLEILVKEYPIIEKININGIKKKSFIEAIYSSISLKDRTSFTDFKLENDITIINNMLKASGYYFQCYLLTGLK